MAFTPISPIAGLQSMTETSTTQKFPLGTIIQARDPTYGVGDFIYLQGVANTVVGSIVTYDTAGATALSTVGGNVPKPVAVAQSANVANQYGWYQIGGIAAAYKLATVSLAAGVAVAVKTVGRISKTGSGKEILGAYVYAVASATTGRTSVYLMISRPHKQGRIT